MANENTLTQFRAWCHKVLPLVYDDSLSYYEVLCRVFDYLNKVIDATNGTIEDVEELKSDLRVVENWIANFNTSYAEKIIADKIATMIFLEISDSGYIMYYIPDNWDDVTFNTTGLDVSIGDTEYGRLVLAY